MKRDVDVIKHYVNKNFVDLKSVIESQYRLSVPTDTKTTFVNDITNILEIVFKCDVYYNDYNEVCKITIIDFL
mgnify:CR=1 FL=1